MRILVAGDLSGRAARVASATGTATVAVRAIDLDNFDDVLRRLSPSVVVPPDRDDASSITVEFTKLDDFHPDHLFRTHGAFAGLRASRERLLDPATLEQETAALSQNHLLGERPAPPAPIASPRAVSAASITDDLIRKFVQPHIVPGAAHDPAPYLAALDATASELMRQVLHDAGFQRLEASWRGIRWLVENLELGDDLELAVLDASRSELLACLEHGFGDDAPGLVVNLDTIGAAPDDLDFLTRVAAAVAPQELPYFAAAGDALAQAGDPVEAWQRLRQGPAGQWLALAHPRWLLRLPYGSATEAAESFAFEEFSGTPVHEDYLWGNPALPCALILGQAYLDNGWEQALPGSFDITDLPAHTVRHDGETRMQACAEFFMTTETAEALVRSGISPLVSHRNRNAVRLLRAWRQP
jgi:type VI secretion system protein ImpC